MRDTHILLDTDFLASSIYRSTRAEEKLLNWCAWAKDNLSDKQLLEIERALKKQGRGRL